VLPKSRLGIDSDDIGDDDDVDEDPVTYDRTAPFVAYASDGSQDVSRILLNTLSNSIRQRKKKKLVIRGVRSNERRKLEAARRWCERFGEVNQIVRMPNEDLHVDFKSAEVAETVCRLRAKVFISGVGSVYLSWYVGK